MDGSTAGPTYVLLFGVAIVAGIVAKAWLRHFDVPGLVGYLAIGVGYAALDRSFLHLPPEAHGALGLLADIGVVCLLFRVGLESDLAVLVRELPRAVLVLAVNVGLSFALGYVAARFVLGFAAVPALFAGVALSATSIAVAAYVWEGAGLLRSRVGALVIDVAELDDIAAVLLMVLLFAAVPVMRGEAGVAESVVPAVLAVLVKSVLFGAGCVAFARFGERRLTATFRRLRHGPAPMLVLVGVAFVIAAFAGWLGFSLAVGALFAGLVFARDPRAVRAEASFEPVHDLFAPFFFIHVGANVDVDAMSTAIGCGAVLLVAGVAGKLCGTMLPLWPTLGARAAAVVGLGMVPRAEIALFVVDQGRRMGDDVVPASLHGAMVCVVGATCLLTPPVLRRLLTRNRALFADAPGDSRGDA